MVVILNLKFKINNKQYFLTHIIYEVKNPIFATFLIIKCQIPFRVFCKTKHDYF